VVRWFDLASGNGAIARDDGGDEVFFNFTAIPGEGYRTIRAGTPVVFEVVDNPTGPTARNIQQIEHAVYHSLSEKETDRERNDER
jgi:cold shock CspA family protein